MTPVPFQGETLSGTRTSAGRTESGGERHKFEVTGMLADQEEQQLEGQREQ